MVGWNREAVIQGGREEKLIRSLLIQRGLIHSSIEIFQILLLESRPTIPLAITGRDEGELKIVAMKSPVSFSEPRARKGYKESARNRKVEISLESLEVLGIGEGGGSENGREIWGW